MRNYARALNLYYRYDPEEGTLTFEDGTVYTLAEAIALSKKKESPEDVGKIHLVKRFFEGVIEEFPYGYPMPQAHGKVRPSDAVPVLRKVGRRKKSGSPPEAVQMRLEL